MHTVTIHEAKATLSGLIEEALSGQEAVIAGLWEIFIKLRSGKLTVDSGDPAAANHSEKSN